MRNQNVFERVEKKYRLNQKQYDLFLNGAADRIHMNEYGLHTIRNIYYDTPDYELIRRSADKPKYKEKLRLRGYGEIGEDSPVFLEIKKKYQGVVYKRRAQLALGQARTYLNTGIREQQKNQILEEIDYFHRLELTYDGECTVLNPGEYLMEIKVNAAYPIWLADLLGKLDIYPSSFSKYGAVYAQAMRKESEREDGQICLQVY